MSAPEKAKSDPKAFKEVVKGPLAGRVYNDGRVIIGGQVYDNLTHQKVKIEVEITADSKTAKEFFESMISFIKISDGSYS